MAKQTCPPWRCSPAAIAFWIASSARSGNRRRAAPPETRCLQMRAMFMRYPSPASGGPASAERTTAAAEAAATAAETATAESPAAEAAREDAPAAATGSAAATAAEQPEQQSEH